MNSCCNICFENSHNLIKCEFCVFQYCDFCFRKMKIRFGKCAYCRKSICSSKYNPLRNYLNYLKKYTNIRIN